MDHYKTLGVAANATADEIKQAYRRLASKHHPDRGGDTATFQKIQAAYDVLGDSDKRRQYDNPAANMSGMFNGGFNPFEDIFAHFTRQQQQHHQQKRIYTVTVFVSLEKVAMGGIETIQIQTLQGIKSFQIKIPQSVEDGQQVRYEGLLPDGFLQITFRIHANPKYERRGLDLYSTVEISIFDLILGTEVIFHTIMGQELSINIPAGTKPNSTLRLNGQGLRSEHAQGTQYLLISATIPDKISPELLELIKTERQQT